MFFAGLAAAQVNPRAVAAGIAVAALAWSAAWTVWRRRLFRARS
ncbi:MAG: hypothetical protein ACRDKS_05330 [Actinomycetota bacterium]